eukprot:gene15143-16700_t
MGKTKKKVVDNEDEVELRRLCKYIGSFAINMMKAEERQNLMNERLEELKNVKKGIHVLMLITSEGIKIYDEKERNVKMAHAITRIAFSTCTPDSKLFAYVARSASTLGPSILQAHVFKTKKGSHSQQMAAIISKAFRIVFAMATLDRNSKIEEFESEVGRNKQDTSPMGQRRRWAKKEIARGHDLSEHAERAKKNNPLSMIPGQPDPSDLQMFPSRKVSQSEFDNQIIAQSFTTSPGRGEAGSDVIYEDIKDKDYNGEACENMHHAASTTATKAQVIAEPRVDNQLDRGNEAVPEELPSGQKSLAESTNDAMQEFIEGRVATQHLIPRVNTTSNGSSSEDSGRSEDGQQARILMLNQTQNGDDGNDVVYENMHKTGIESQKEIYVEREIASAQDESSAGKENGDVSDETKNEEKRDSPIQSIQVEGNPSVTFEKTESESDSCDEATESRLEKSENEQKKPCDDSLAVNGVDNRSTTPYMFAAIPEPEHGNAMVEKKRPLTVTDDQLMRDSYWYQPGLSREISEEILANEKVGSFFIRESTSNPGSYAITIKLPKFVKDSEIGNMLIERISSGDFRIFGLNRSFPSLPMLVAYYASFQDELPVKLRLSNENPMYDAQDGDNKNNHGDQVDGPASEVITDPDYKRFCSSEGIMRELSQE